MTIIILTTSTHLSGGTRQALYLALGFQRRGFQVFFVCPGNSLTQKYARETGLTCVGLPNKLFAAEKAMRELMPAGEPVILHAFHNRGVKWAAYMGTLWRLKKLPTVCVAHRGVTSRPGNPLPYLLPGIRAYLVNSRACAKTLPLLWRKKRCFVVNNSVPAERITPSRPKAEILTDLNIPHNHLIVGNISNNNPKKGAERAIAAFARVKDKMPLATLMVVGVTPEKWLPLCAELNVSDRVRLIPETSAVANYLQCMDLFVFPSSFIESQPNVIIEAMCMGVPVIAGATGGVPELLPPQCLFNPADEVEIAEKLTSIMCDPDERARLGNGNLAKRDEFSLDFRLDAVMRHYWNCLKELGLAAPN